MKRDLYLLYDIKFYHWINIVAKVMLIAIRPDITCTRAALEAVPSIVLMRNIPQLIGQPVQGHFPTKQGVVIPLNQVFSNL
jgi:hypothetical protein